MLTSIYYLVSAFASCLLIFLGLSLSVNNNEGGGYYLGTGAKEKLESESDESEKESFFDFIEMLLEVFVNYERGEFTNVISLIPSKFILNIVGDSWLSLSSYSDTYESINKLKSFFLLLLLLFLLVLDEFCILGVSIGFIKSPDSSLKSES